MRGGTVLVIADIEPLANVQGTYTRSAGPSLLRLDHLSSPRTGSARKLERLLLVFFLFSLPLLNPWVRGDGVGYYAFARAPLIEHNFNFERDYQAANPSFRGGPRDPLDAFPSVCPHRRASRPFDGRPCGCRRLLCALSRRDGLWHRAVQLYRPASFRASGPQVRRRPLGFPRCHFYLVGHFSSCLHVLQSVVVPCAFGVCRRTLPL